jgi:BAAT / Acyl-CoA thioester hydrolase C terminal
MHSTLNQLNFNFMKTILILITYLICLSAIAQKRITFKAPDGVTIFADVYETKTNDKIMLLCHQAGYSKGEYFETAKKLNALGYTCVAIDQRSGDSINNDINLTAKMATLKKLNTGFIDAEVDIVTAVNHVFNLYKKKIIVMGSSYSSSLILKIATTLKDKIAATISYSPGEYFTDKTLVSKNLALLTIPVYITCSKKEITPVEKLFNQSLMKNITFFKPTQDGNHGSKVLWSRNPNNKEYWDSLVLFLKGL